MSRTIYSLIILISATFAQVSWAGTGLSIYGGYSQHRQDSMEDTNTFPTGLTYGAGYLVRKEFYEIEFYAKKGSFTSEITHDGAKNTIEHDQLQFGAALNFFLTKKLYARLGYNFAKVDQTFQKPMSTASTAAAKNEYGLVEEELVDGLNIGGGYVIWNGKKVDFLVQYDFYYFNKIKATQNSISLGFKYYID